MQPRRIPQWVAKMLGQAEQALLGRAAVAKHREQVATIGTLLRSYLVRFQRVNFLRTLHAYFVNAPNINHSHLAFAREEALAVV